MAFLACVETKTAHLIAHNNKNSLHSTVLKVAKKLTQEEHSNWAFFVARLGDRKSGPIMVESLEHIYLIFSLICIILILPDLKNTVDRFEIRWTRKRCVLMLQINSHERNFFMEYLNGNFVSRLKLFLAVVKYEYSKYLVRSCRSTHLRMSKPKT
jgi:hypothetical protein